ncbi:unnamed protein product [Cochlearia groenlandica]
METQTLTLTFLLFFLYFTYIIVRKMKPKPNLPPSPPWSLPVIGHLRLIKPPLHHTFLALSKSLNNAPIFSLRLGNRLVFIVSSRSIFEECFTKNDIVLANRGEFFSSKHILYDHTAMISAPYGDHWRNLRRIGTLEIFSAHRLNSFASIRRDETRRLIVRLAHNSSQEYAKVEMKSMFSDLTFNNIVRMVAGKRYYGDGLEDDPVAKRVRRLIEEAFANADAGNAADYLPVLRWVTSYEKRVKKLARGLDEFLQGLVDEKREAKEKSNTMIDHLLSLQETEPEYFTDRIIKGYMLTMIIAGTDTTSVTLEWAMSNLLNHPQILKKARTEIDEKIGLNRLVDEPDITNLPYLQNIISETIRLYPAVPLLLPHVASQDCKVSGYDVPRGTMLLTNVWAMHRDPKVWEDSEIFKPERFGEEGESEKLMLFGMGRRACPGASLANRLVGLVLATLVQCFEWERVSEELVDMSEDKGATLPKLVPLRAMCKARDIVGKVM